MRKEFIGSIMANCPSFGIELSDEQSGRLADYFALVMEHNELLHLVAPCSAEEFAVRHILESLTLLEHLPVGAKVVDVGTGAGLPAIPCLLARDDLTAKLVESKEKKARFLKMAVDGLGLSGRAEVINKQFAETNAGDAHFVTCRALDRFTERLPALVRWTKRRKMLLFGGNNLDEALRKQKVPYARKLMPLSEQRYLFSVEPQLG